MSCCQIQTEHRRYPLRRPDGWKPKFPRWMLELPREVETVYITYIGVQPRHEHHPAIGTFAGLHPHVASGAQRQAAKKIESWIQDGPNACAPKLWEKFYVETGYDVPDTEIWVLYWIDKTAAKAAAHDLQLQQIQDSLPPDQGSLIGLWRESFEVPKARFETNYSGNDYRPGIAALDGASQVPHDFTGYWGAARDRLPSSSHDEFTPKSSTPIPDFEKSTKNRAVCGKNEDQLIHIRSGQYWERCPSDEQEAYENTLEPVLRKGMAYLENDPSQTGDFGLRFVRNLVSNQHTRVEERKLNGFAHGISNGQQSEEPARPRRETCSAGFFRSLQDLEAWAAKHQTHKDIFHGAHAHSTKFGKQTYKMRTWHEVSVLKPGEICYEYVNCEPRTGLIPFVRLSIEDG